jgi:hypothetical protein
MTTNPTLNPQLLGQAENAHRALLGRFLAGTGVAYQHWVALTLVASSGAAIDRDALVSRVNGALKVDQAAALATIADLTAGELLETLPGHGNGIGLTEAGGSLYRETRSAIDEVIGRVYGDIPADDLATAGRVLALVTARVNAELAA